MKSLTPWEYIMARRRFTLFPNLPVEIRQIIWRKNLKARLVEVWPKGGRIRFNFHLDTLYIDWKIQEHLASFLLSITQHEARNFQYIFIDGDIRYGHFSYDQREVNMAMLRRDPSLRHQVQTDCNSVKFEEDELQLILSALSSMPMLKKLHLIYDAAPMDSEGLYQNHDEFSRLIIFNLWEVFDLFPRPPNPGCDYRVKLLDMVDEICVDSFFEEIWEKFEGKIPDLDVRYGWRFPKSFTPPPYAYSSPSFQDRIGWWKEYWN
ncbi:hypothetical protein OCU04_006641 [Sclerotinia nivalis]|uniref:2EXR domain-containing protein n=1 Tax=Sclerotinia nivalis TaxID=352851 RepID=A0A9X0AK63_9HELO|nr:hypothetical protein OCU04_006641 [Sclerotinia nivalis]